MAPSSVAAALLQGTALLLFLSPGRAFRSLHKQRFFGLSQSWGTLEQFLKEKLCPGLPETFSQPEHLDFFGPVQSRLELSPAFINPFTASHSPSCCCLGGAVSVTVLHLRDWSQKIDYNVVALQH